MRLSVKLLILVLFATLALVTQALADSINNLALTLNSGCPASGCTLGAGPPATDTYFYFPTTGTLAIGAINASDEILYKLRVVIFDGALSASDIACSTNVLAACSVTTRGGATIILFSSPYKYPNGIFPSRSFTINFGCATGSCNWPSGQLVGISWAAAPEPSSLVTVATGIGMLFARRRRWRVLG